MNHKNLYRSFQQRGIPVDPDALKVLLEFLDRENQLLSNREYASNYTSPSPTSTTQLLNLITKERQNFSKGNSFVISHVVSKEIAIRVVQELEKKHQHHHNLGMGISEDNQFDQEISHKENEHDPDCKNLAVRKKILLYMQAVDAFSMPHPYYHATHKMFMLDQSQETSLQSISHRSSLVKLSEISPESKTDMFRTRFHLILQRILRDDRFCQATTSSLLQIHKRKRQDEMHSDRKYSLTTIDSLVGSTDGSKKCVFGMLTKHGDGDETWFLEDCYGTIALDLSKVLMRHILLTDTSFVLVQGIVVDKAESTHPKYIYSSRTMASRHIFQVSDIGCPMIESRRSSLENMENMDFSGTFSAVSTEEDRLVLKQYEENNPNELVLILSEVNLDNEKVLEALDRIFLGYLEDGVVPAGIILMGSFVSKRLGLTGTGFKQIKSMFDCLGKVISKYSPIATTTWFVFIPGPNDLNSGMFLPQARIPHKLTVGLENQYPRMYFMSNPCRMRILSQELVLFRDDLFQKTHRNRCKLNPMYEQSAKNEERIEYFVKGMLSQGRLSYIPQSVSPILWSHDHAMWLQPLPDVVILGDEAQKFSILHDGTRVCNPGNFSDNFEFLAYYPAQRKMEASMVPM